LADDSAPPLDTSQSAEQLLLQAADLESAECGRYPARDWLRNKVVCDDDLSRYGLRL
jgi:hypothetical protein